MPAIVKVLQRNLLAKEMRNPGDLVFILDEEFELIQDTLGTVNELDHFIGGGGAGISVWDNTKTYKKDTVVRSGAGLFYALQDVPAGTDISDTVYWNALGGAGSVLWGGIGGTIASQTDLAPYIAQNTNVEVYSAIVGNAVAVGKIVEYNGTWYRANKAIANVPATFAAADWDENFIVKIDGGTA